MILSFLVPGIAMRNGVVGWDWMSVRMSCGSLSALKSRRLEQIATWVAMGFVARMDATLPVAIGVSPSQWW